MTDTAAAAAPPAAGSFAWTGRHVIALAVTYPAAGEMITRQAGCHRAPRVPAR